MPVLNRSARHEVTFTLNGEDVSGHAEPRMLLSDFLRHEIGATGTHVGCEHGICGACTVRIDGKAVRSCLMLAAGVLEREPDISDADMLEVLSSNLCRCTGYANIVKAVRAAAVAMRRR